jgi:hypothetical protein
MTATFIAKVPGELVEQLFNEDDMDLARRSRLSTEQRELAVNWLRRILVDFSALDEHIALLQKCYNNAPFSYSRPGARLDLESAATSSDLSRFTHHERLPESDETRIDVTTILNQGVAPFLNVDREEELRRLLLNPVAVYDLFDVIDEIQPSHWLAEMTAIATPQFAAQEQAIRGLFNQEYGFSPAEENVQDSLPRVSEQQLAKRMREATPLAREANTRRFIALGYVLATAATVAILAVGWGVIRMGDAIRKLPEQLAMLPATKSNSYDNRDTRFQNQSATSSGNTHTHGSSLKRLVTDNELTLTDEYTADDCISRLERSGPPEIKELVLLLREYKHLDNRRIVEYLLQIVPTAEPKDGQ